MSKNVPFHIVFGKIIPRRVAKTQQEIDNRCNDLEELDGKIASCQLRLDSAIADGKPRTAEKAGKGLQRLKSARGRVNGQLKRARRDLNRDLDQLEGMVVTAQERVNELTRKRQFRNAAAQQRDLLAIQELLATLRPDLDSDDLLVVETEARPAATGDDLLVVEIEARPAAERKTAAA